MRFSVLASSLIFLLSSTGRVSIVNARLRVPTRNDPANTSTEHTRQRPNQLDNQNAVNAAHATTQAGALLLPTLKIVAPKQERRNLQGIAQAAKELEGLGGDPDMQYLPLQLCEGDCDSDEDCDEGLVCFERDPNDPVPGCLGGEEESSKTDFCVPLGSAGLSTGPPTEDDKEDEADTTASTTTRSPTNATSATMATASKSPTTAPAENGPSSFNFPTTSPDTEGNETPYPSFTPTMKPTTKSPTTTGPTTKAPTTTGPTTKAPTTSKPTTKTPSSLGPTTKAPTSAAPTTIAPAPTTFTGTIAPSTEAPMPELDKIGNNGSPSEIYPLGLCQGDCDDDDDCADGLICFERDQGDPVPGCLGEDDSRSDYCILDPNRVPTGAPTFSRTPTNTPTTIVPTISIQPTSRPSVSSKPSSAPSDIPSDVPSDVPSLSPSTSLSPTITPVPTVPPSGAPTIEPLEGIRLKLYWEEGYTWQDETIERKWCMISDYNGFPGTGKCWHGLVTQPCHQDMVYIARCDSDKRQMFTIIPMPGGSQYLISLYAENLCMERYDYSIVLRKCNSWNPLQRFWIPRGAIFQKHFELSPITLANHCLTQSHHPKSGEVVELHKCSRVRAPESQTSYWNIYTE